MKPIVTRFAVCLGLLCHCGASEPSAAPIFRIEAGMHTGAINGISADSAGRLALTVSDDKTARLWELPGGRLVRVLRPPIGAGREGMLFCGALSPDGRLAAVGGWTGQEWDESESVYLFDTATGRMVYRFLGLPNIVTDLAFSASGRWLAAGHGAGGIEIWDAASSHEMAFDRGDGESSIHLDWHGDEQLVSTSSNGKLHLYTWHGEPPMVLTAVLTTALTQGTHPGPPRFSPDGLSIAVGFEDTTSVEVLATSDLSRLFGTKAIAVDNGGLTNVAWSADGAALVAGGDWPAKGTTSKLRMWGAAGRGSAHNLTVTTSNLQDLRSLAGNRWLFATDRLCWGIISAKGAVSILGKSPVADFQECASSLRVSANARRVTIGERTFGANWMDFDLDRRPMLLASSSKASGAALHSPRVIGLGVKCWKDAQNPTLKGQSLEMEDPDDVAHCLAIAPDRSYFVLGTELRMYCFTATRSKRWSLETTGAVRAVNLSADGRLVVAAGDDGVIHWRRADTGEELLALYPHIDRKRWVAWTPQGYYACSASGEELLGRHVNHLEGQAADFFPAKKYREQFHRPDVIRRALNLQRNDR